MGGLPATQFASSVSCVLAMMIAPASRRFFVSVASYGGTRFANANAPPVVGKSVVWMLSFSAIGMPCSGPRIFPAARSRSRSSASFNAFGLTVIAACSLSSYVAMRMRYCCTSSCAVTRPSLSAACMSEMLASTTLNGAGFGFVAAETVTVMARTRRADVTLFMARDCKGLAGSGTDCCHSTDKSVCATSPSQAPLIGKYGRMVWHRHSCLCWCSGDLRKRKLPLSLRRHVPSLAPPPLLERESRTVFLRHFHPVLADLTRDDGDVSEVDVDVIVGILAGHVAVRQHVN